MKKAMLLTVITGLILVPISAQEFKIGTKAGLNLASFGGDFEDGKTRTSFHLGGMVEIPVIAHLSVQPELLYSAQGAKSDFNNDEVARFDYLTLPVLAKYYISEGLAIEAGPQLGFLLSAKVEEDNETEDQKDLAKATDLGLVFGLGYRMNNGISFGARYFFGSDINDVPEDPDKITNNVFQISVGYFFY